MMMLETCLHLTTAFERYNIQTITAESGQEAMKILNENMI